MKRELELKDICGYFPYRLKVIELDDDNRVYDLSRILLFNGIFKVGICQQFNGDFFDEGDIPLKRITPILHPLSDLNKPIFHNGKEEVPILELAKVCSPESDWLYRNEMAISTDNSLGFLYDERDDVNAFVMVVEELHQLTLVANQHQLFDKMNEYRIDYRGLIDAKLAISVYDLEENPYSV